MQTTITLTEFLLARIAEDEAVARRAARQKLAGPLIRWNAESVHLTGGALDATDRAHAARFDPARVLAECEAKRQIVEWHKSWPVLVETPPEFEAADPTDPSSMTFRMSKQIAWATEQQYRDRFGTEPPTGPVLRFLALPYADHADFREEWRA